MVGSSGVIIAVGLRCLLICQITMLLHLEEHITFCFFKFIGDVCQTFPIGLLLLVLLLLALIGHTNVAIIINLCLQFVGAFFHIIDLLRDLGAKLIAIAFSANLVFHLAKLSQTVLEPSQVTLNFLISLAHLVRYQSLWGEKLLDLHMISIRTCYSVGFAFLRV